MNTEAMIDKLASKLGDEELLILAQVMSKVAERAAEGALTKEQQRDVLIDKLASAGFTPREVQAELVKMAEEKAVQDECEKIAQDCMAMGTIIGNTASGIFLNNIRGFISKHAEDDESDEDMSESEKKDHESKEPPQFEEGEKEEEKEDAEEDKKEGEKEASARRYALRQALLQAAKL